MAEQLLAALEDTQRLSEEHLARLTSAPE
jgi:hypothetical protein